MRSTTTAFATLPFLILVAVLPSAAQTAQPAGPDLSTVLAKASAYVAGYVKSFASVVSEERYLQTRRQRGTTLTAESFLTTTLVSDYLLVAVSGTSDWMPFRDVYSVDGAPIRDRSNRLLKLFVDAPADAYQQALRIRDESSRYNIGSGLRDTNVPTFALPFLTDQLRGRFAFTLKGRERLSGADTVVVEFVETATPTIIAGADGQNVPARGRFWADPADGRVLRTRLETRPNGWTNTIEVDFRFEPTMDLLVPSQMTERRSGGSETVEGRAVYTNFRRFRVDTSIQIK